MDTEQLVEKVTKAIMDRLNGAPGQAVVFGDVPPGVLAPGVSCRAGHGAGDTEGADYIVLTQAAFRAFHGGAIPAGLTGAVAPVAGGGEPCASCGAENDLTGKKVIGERDIRTLGLTKGARVRVDKCAIVTALARDYAQSQGIDIVC